MRERTNAALSSPLEGEDGNATALPDRGCDSLRPSASLERSAQRVLEASQLAIVFRVRTDPKPYNRLALANAHRAPMDANANGINWALRIDLLELERPMIGIVCPDLVGPLRLPPLIARKLAEKTPKMRGCPRNHFGWGNSSGVVRPALNSANASSANLRSASCVSAMDLAQRASSASSSRMIAPMASCSSRGRLRTAAMALSSRSVMAMNIICSAEFLKTGLSVLHPSARRFAPGQDEASFLIPLPFSPHPERARRAPSRNARWLRGPSTIPLTKFLFCSILERMTWATPTDECRRADCLPGADTGETLILQNEPNFGHRGPCRASHA